MYCVYFCFVIDLSYIAVMYIFCDARFLEGDEGEDTCMISQEDIAEAVDITSGAKVIITSIRL